MSHARFRFCYDGTKLQVMIFFSGWCPPADWVFVTRPLTLTDSATFSGLSVCNDMPKDAPRSGPIAFFLGVQMAHNVGSVDSYVWLPPTSLYDSSQLSSMGPLPVVGPYQLGEAWYPFWDFNTNSVAYAPNVYSLVGTAIAYAYPPAV